jgi:hypothetical protein
MGYIGRPLLVHILLPIALGALNSITEMVGEFKLDAGFGLGWKFLEALFCYFPPVSHDTNAHYEALGKKVEKERCGVCSTRAWILSHEMNEIFISIIEFLELVNSNEMHP